MTKLLEELKTQDLINSQANYLSANINYEMTKMQTAYNEIQEAIQHNPLNHQAYNLKGVILDKAARNQELNPQAKEQITSEIEKCFKTAFHIFPIENYCSNYVISLTAQNKLTESEKLLELADKIFVSKSELIISEIDLGIKKKTITLEKARSTIDQYANKTGITSANKNRLKKFKVSLLLNHDKARQAFRLATKLLEQNKNNLEFMTLYYETYMKFRGKVSSKTQTELKKLESNYQQLDFTTMLNSAITNS